MKLSKLQEQLINHRKNLNSLAEIGNKEYNTSSYIKAYLDKIGVEYESYLDTAVVGMINGKNPKKTIAFRSDIDALPTECGARHLCGHDGHMSILLGLIEYLNINIESLNDNIVFIFQPAEEGPGGAKPLVDAKIFEKYNIDEIYGLHIYPEINQGTIGIKEGYFFAQVGEFDIDITTKGGHGAMPHTAIDGIVVASNFVSNLQTIVSRNISPIDTSVVTVGKIEGGSARNIIAEKVRLEGTLRTFNANTYDTMKSRIVEMAKGFEVSYNCKFNIEIRDCYPAVNNDLGLYEEFLKAMGDKEIINLPPLMISEDFSYYQEKVPGLFVMLGARNEEKGYVHGLHNAKFNFDEDIFVDALDMYTKLLKYKNSIL